MTATTHERPTPSHSTAPRLRTAGMTTAVGAAVMLLGTVFWAASGADLDGALENGTIGEYLTEASANQTLLAINLSLWILGVLVMGAGGILLSRHGAGDGDAAAIARAAFTAGPAAAIVFFSMWLGIVLGLAPAYVAGASVEPVAVALGEAASIADWIATVLILGVGAVALAFAGRESWVPRWLFRWGLVSGAAGALAIAGLVLDMRTTLAFPDVVIGLGFLIAAGIVAIRHDG